MHTTTTPAWPCSAPYGVKLDSHVYETPTLDYREAEHRYPRLHMAPDFVQAVACWAPGGVGAQVWRRGRGAAALGTTPMDGAPSA